MVATLHDKKVIDIAGGFYHSIVLVKHKKQREVSLLAADMKKIVNEPSRADVTFIVEGKPVHAHRCIMFVRCRALEERIRNLAKRTDDRDKTKWGINHPNHMTLEIQHVNHKSFIGFLEYLYTDKIKSLKNN